MRRACMFVLASAIVLCGWNLLGAAEPSANPRDADAIQREIAETQAKLERLANEAMAADQRAAQEEELAYYRSLAADRLGYAKAEFDDLSLPSEYGPPTAAQMARLQARLAHLEACRVTDEKIIALRGAPALKTAKELQQSRDVLDLRWAMVTGPTTDRAVVIESLQDAATVSAKASELFAALKKLHEQDAKDGEAEFAMRKQRIQTENEVSRLTDAILNSAVMQ